MREKCDWVNRVMVERYLAFQKSCSSSANLTGTFVNDANSGVTIGNAPNFQFFFKEQLFNKILNIFHWKYAENFKTSEMTSSAMQSQMLLSTPGEAPSHDSALSLRPPLPLHCSVIVSLRSSDKQFWYTLYIILQNTFLTIIWYLL